MQTANLGRVQAMLEPPSLMGGVRVTKHAAMRWRERVQPCSYAEARAAILAHSPAITAAAAFGASHVRLATRHRLVLEGATVVTVLSPSRFSWDRY